VISKQVKSLADSEITETRSMMRQRWPLAAVAQSGGLFGGYRKLTFFIHTLNG